LLCLLYSGICVAQGHHPSIPMPPTPGSSRGRGGGMHDAHARGRERRKSKYCMLTPLRSRTAAGRAIHRGERPSQTSQIYSRSCALTQLRPHTEHEAYSTLLAAKKRGESCHSKQSHGTRRRLRAGRFPGAWAQSCHRPVCPIYTFQLHEVFLTLTRGEEKAKCATVGKKA